MESAVQSKTTLTSEEVAAELEVSVDAVRDWLTTGVTISTPQGRKRVALRGRKAGGRWRIRREDLDAFIRVTTDAALSPDAVSPVDVEAETPAAYNRRASAAQDRLAKKLGR